MRDGLSFLNDKLCEADELMFTSEQVFFIATRDFSRQYPCQPHNLLNYLQ